MWFPGPDQSKICWESRKFMWIKLQKRGSDWCVLCSHWSAIGFGTSVQFSSLALKIPEWKRKRERQEFMRNSKYEISCCNTPTHKAGWSIRGELPVTRLVVINLHAHFPRFYRRSSKRFGLCISSGSSVFGKWVRFFSILQTVYFDKLLVDRKQIETSAYVIFSKFPPF